jgi:hypothetical protein
MAAPVTGADRDGLCYLNRVVYKKADDFGVERQPEHQCVGLLIVEIDAYGADLHRVKEISRLRNCANSSIVVGKACNLHQEIESRIGITNEAWQYSETCPPIPKAYHLRKRNSLFTSGSPGARLALIT